jgi:hypothetical protein
MLTLNQVVDRTFYINLPHREDRRASITVDLYANGIEAELVDGLYGHSCKVPEGFGGTPGGFGCTLTHLALYAQGLEQGLESMAIFEDDCRFTPEFPRHFQDFWLQVPKDWQLVYLGGNHSHFGAQPPIPINGCPWVGRVQKTLTTHAYFIRREAMKVALASKEAYRFMIDVALTEVQAQVPSYCAVPSLCWQGEGWSDCWETHTNYDYCLKGK